MRLVGPSIATLAVCALLAGARLSADPAAAGPYRSSAWLLAVSPTYGRALFTLDSDSSPALSNAWGGSFLARRKLTDSLSLRSSAAWSAISIAPASGVSVDSSLSELGLTAGAALGRGFAGGLLSADLFLDGGACYGSLSGGGGALYALGRAGAGLDLSTRSGIGGRLEASFDYKAGLYAGLGVGLGVTWNLPEAKASKDGGVRYLELLRLESGYIFPVLRSYYDEHPFGKAVIANRSKREMRDVRVSFFVKGYMSAPKELAVIPSIAPGASVEVPVTALFGEELLKVTEPTKVAAELDLSLGSEPASVKTATVLIQDRTALTWDDDRKAAAFVSSKDPWVLDLVGNVNAAIRNDRNGEVPKNLQSAMAVHEGLRLYGIGYLLSPNRHFAEDKADNATVDNLNFPRQTLSYRSGDCADLSVLYSSCLEAMAIETAFITVPGHIFMAADLGLSPAEALAHGIGAGQFIAQGDRAWVPIETTIRDKGFTEVWQTAMDEWKDASAKGVAAFYPMHESWERYAPVGLPADGSSIQPPANQAVLSAFRSELAALVRDELSARLAALAPASENRPSGKTLNQRGVLYGRYGLLAEAERCFQDAAKIQYGPSIVNLGNVALLKGDPEEASQRFKQALSSSPKDPKLLACLAKAQATLGKDDEVKKTIALLAEVDPAAASRYSSLVQPGSTGVRAAEVASDSTLWF
jgi:tetratricopeptide (TPR) repeat protein